MLGREGAGKKNGSGLERSVRLLEKELGTSSGGRWTERESKANGSKDGRLHGPRKKRSLGRDVGPFGMT